jgi:perosamine synthetase
MVAGKQEQYPMIPIIKPVMDNREAEAASRVILSGWITQGPEVAAFEREFADFVGAKHACAVSNCTTALHLALLAVGIKAGDEVVTVSHSYIATANAIKYCNGIPVFVDIDATTYNIDPSRIEAAITARTRAILCVHQMGMPCDMKSIMDVARQNGLPVIEDAACAIGSEICIDTQWQKIGRPLGDIACFSFHPRKVMSTGDGGMLTTANPSWDARFRQLRQHGMSIPDTARHASPTVIFEAHPEIGYNYRMTDIQAAVGRTQLKRMPEIVATRRRLASRYTNLLKDNLGIVTSHEPGWARSNFQSYCVRLPDRVDQRTVMQSMLDAGVATRRGIMCIHREACYAGASARESLANSESAQDHCIILPLYPQMSEEEQDTVIRELRSAISA